MKCSFRASKQTRRNSELPSLSAGKEASFIHAPSHNAKLLDKQFATLKEAGAHGVMLDVW